MMPVRIQRKRTKGWRMPENTVCVDRPSKYGNPFIMGQDGNPAECVLKYARYVEETFWDEEIQADLGGKNLATWCRLDQPCHADVLLEVANA